MTIWLFQWTNETKDPVAGCASKAFDDLLSVVGLGKVTKIYLVTFLGMHFIFIFVHYTILLL